MAASQDLLTLAKTAAFILLVLPCFVAYIALGHAYLLPRLKPVKRCDRKDVGDAADGSIRSDHGALDGNITSAIETSPSQTKQPEIDIYGRSDRPSVDTSSNNPANEASERKTGAPDIKQSMNTKQTNDKLSSSDEDELERVTTTTIQITTVTSKKAKAAKKQSKKVHETKIPKAPTPPLSPHSASSPVSVPRQRVVNRKHHQTMEILNPLPQLARQARAAELKDLKTPTQQKQDHPYSPFQGLNLLHHHNPSILTTGSLRNCSSNHHPQQGPSCLTPACRGGMPQQHPIPTQVHHQFHHHRNHQYESQMSCRQQSIRGSTNPSYQPSRPPTPIPGAQQSRNDLDFSLFDRRFSSVLGVSPTTR